MDGVDLGRVVRGGEYDQHCMKFSEVLGNILVFTFFVLLCVSGPWNIQFSFPSLPSVDLQTCTALYTFILTCCMFEVDLCNVLKFILYSNLHNYPLLLRQINALFIAFMVLYRFLVQVIILITSFIFLSIFVWYKGIWKSPNLVEDWKQSLYSSSSHIYIN